MFNLSEEHIQLQQTFREFAENEVKPLAKELDETERFPTETVRKMAELGMMGLPIPEEYGGSGIDQIGYVLAVEELSKVCATTGIILSAHTSLCCWPIMTFGTEEQKEKYLKPLASGQKLGAFALTEPSAGTDASMQKSTAVLEGDHYVLNGNKVFITNAGAADVFIVFAMTDKEQGTRGITAFILERDMPGFTMGKPENKMGLRASSTCELVFDNVRVPVENRLGAEGKGFKIAMATLDGGRIGVGAQAVGISQGAIDEAVKFTKERIQFGQQDLPVPEHPVHSRRHADPHGRRAAAGLARRRSRAGRPALQPPRRHGQALRLRDRVLRHQPRRAALRRLRLHQRLPRRAHDARRQGHRDLRGHQ